MKLLFVQGGSRIKVNSKNEIFVDGNFNNTVFEDYCKLANDVTFLLRKDSRIYDDEFLDLKFNKVNPKFNVFSIPDFYRSIKARFNLREIRKVEKIIAKLVKQKDKIIIRSVGNFYTNTVLKYCKKYKKSYLIEVTGFAFNALWYHSLRGKIVAVPRELYLKKALKNAPYAVYVTEEALQKRYPCKGVSLGCSDVRLCELNENVLNRRLDKIQNHSGKIVLGTAAFLDVKWKGQIYIIRALALLKKRGFTQFEYQMIGAGDGEKLKKEVNKYHLEDQVKILGAKPHDKVFEWLDSIDVYVQPSFQEGLCRAIVEAMSRACPIICSDVGGNYELIDRDWIFGKADVKGFANCLLQMDTENLKKQAKKNFEHSLDYDKQKLDAQREEFYKNFIEDKNS